MKGERQDAIYVRLAKALELRFEASDLKELELIYHVTMLKLWGQGPSA